MNYRSTRIYLRSLALIDIVAEMERPPSGYAFLADQLRRAAASVSLNYFEGCGRAGAADRQRFFHIAIGSAHEAAGVFDVMARYRFLSAAECRNGLDLCDHLIAMLRRFR